MKRGGIWMAGLFLAGLLGGCAGGQRSLSKPELMNLAVERVEERYGVSCTATTALEEGSGPFGPVTMVVTLESGGETFQASMDTDGGNIRDNYPLVWMRPRAEEAAQSLAEAVWPDAVGTAELTAAPFSEQMEEEDSLADFFACASPLAEWDIQIPEGKDGQEEKAGAFVEALYGEGLWGRITLRFTDGEVFLHGTASFQPDAEEIAQAFETEGNE